MLPRNIEPQDGEELTWFDLIITGTLILTLFALEFLGNIFV